VPPAESRASIEEVWAAGAWLGEGPTWDPVTASVYWTDIKGKRLFAYRITDRAKREWPLPFRLGSLARPPHAWKPPCGLTGEAFVGCCDEGFAWLGLGPDAVQIVALSHPELHLPGNRFNDGKFGPDGRYWAGTMDDNECELSGNLYAFSADGQFQCLDRGYGVPNGPAFGSDGRTVYHTDSARRRIYAFTLNHDGSLGDKRIFHQFLPEEGSPDGMTVGSDGTLWIAMWDGARLERLAPDGRRLSPLAMPVARCTSCVFVDEKTLFVTSASTGKDSASSGGGLFLVELCG
jgi:sugar lactone lactonase YvrE